DSLPLQLPASAVPGAGLPEPAGGSHRRLCRRGVLRCAVACGIGPVYSGRGRPPAGGRTTATGSTATTGTPPLPGPVGRPPVPPGRPGQPLGECRTGATLGGSAAGT